MSKKKELKVLIATPALHSVDARFYQSMMSLNSIYPTSHAMEIGSLVYMARNRLASTAVAHDFSHIVWLDSDMVFQSDTVTKLIDHAKTGKDFVTGLYFSRGFPMKPIVMQEIIWDRKEDGKIVHGAKPYYDYPRDTMFEAAGCGFGCCITSVEMVAHVAAAFGQSPFDPFPSLGEDYTFCWKAGKLGYKCWCDSRIKAGHVGEFIYDEEVYLENLPKEATS
jgi:GT2 family glycosyltransferase